MNTDLIKQDGNFFTYKSDEFVTIIVKHIFNIEYTPRNYCLARLLCAYLMRTNKIYKTEKKIQDKEKMLYHSTFSAKVETRGTKLFIFLNIKTIDEKIIEENILKDVISYFKDMIMKPNFIKNELNKEVLDEIKKDILNNAQRTEKNPDRMQAILFYRNLLPESDFNYKNSTYEEIKDMLENIDDEDIIDLYHTILNSHVATYTFGNLSDEENKLIRSSFKFKSIDFDYNYEKKEEIKNDYKVINSNDTTQSYLYVAYDIKDFTKDNVPIYYALIPMFVPFKGLCHKVLREELGLVYFTTVDFFLNRGIFFITAQIDKKNVDKTIAGIDDIMKRILDKCFLSETLQFSKEKFTQEAETCEEDLGANILNIEKYILRNDITRKELVDKINTLTVDDIIKQINNFEKKYTFLYEGDKNAN